MPSCARQNNPNYGSYDLVVGSDKTLPAPAWCHQSQGGPFGIHPECHCGPHLNGVTCSNHKMFDRESSEQHSCKELMEMTDGKPAAACNPRNVYQKTCTYKQFVDENQQAPTSISVCNNGDTVEIPVKQYDEACWEQDKTNLSVTCIDGDGNTSVFNNTQLSCKVLVPAAQQLSVTKDLQKICTIGKPCDLEVMAMAKGMHIYGKMETQKDITDTMNFKAGGVGGSAWCNRLTNAGIKTPPACVTTPS